MLEDGYDLLKKKNLLNLAIENPITKTVENKIHSQIINISVGE